MKLSLREKPWYWFSHNTELFFKPSVNTRKGAACHKIYCSMYSSKFRFKAFQIFASACSEEPRPCRNGTTPLHKKNNAPLCSSGCPAAMSCVWSRWKFIVWGNRSCAPSISNNLFLLIWSKNGADIFFAFIRTVLAWVRNKSLKDKSNQGKIKLSRYCILKIKTKQKKPNRTLTGFIYFISLKAIVVK